MYANRIQISQITSWITLYRFTPLPLPFPFLWLVICIICTAVSFKLDIQQLESTILPPSAPPPPPWQKIRMRYLGNKKGYQRSAGGKTIGLSAPIQSALCVGHTSWGHNRRSQKSSRPKGPPTRSQGPDTSSFFYRISVFLCTGGGGGHFCEKNKTINKQHSSGGK